jgi:hypothetical protein
LNIYSNKKPNKAKIPLTFGNSPLLEAIHINIIHEIHSNIAQKPTMQPGTYVLGLSILEKYTETPKIMQAINIGKGTMLFSLSSTLLYMSDFNLHMLFLSGTVSLGHF